jgi:hypothetical protein
MIDALYYLLILVLLGGAGFAGYVAFQSYTGGAMPAMPLFGSRADRRLDVIEQSNVDGKRKLVLIRRDDVEHLIMTGGPVDVVIETGIGQPPPRRVAEVVEATAAVYSRPARRFGQAVGE